MKKVVVLVLISIICTQLPAGGGSASELWIDSFSDAGKQGDIPKGWEPLVFKKIKRHSSYKLTTEDSNFVVMATSEASASGIIKKVSVDLEEFPVLKWRWKVENILPEGDARKKSGDDFAARIYITFEYESQRVSFFDKIKYETYKLFYGEYPPQGAISYIWANKLPKGEMIDNAYTDRVKMIAVESGEERLGSWQEESRNLLEDFTTLFGYKPPKISGIAIMTDSDNTGGTTRAFFDDLRFIKTEFQ